MFTDGSMQSIPQKTKPTGYYLPDVSAAAGMDTEINNSELKRIPVDIPGWETDVIFINVYGDSMYPKYNAGEIIGVKPIEFHYLNYGYPYVVVFQNGDVHIKIVQPGSTSEHLILESVNDFYKPKEFHLERLKSFYSIKGVIKKEMM
jgi:phage repressor protein C with HTH and peptisase S24 domain